MHIDNKRICELLQRHDPKGFNLLLENYYRPLVLWADTYLKDIPASEDLVQEFIVNSWEKRIYGRITPDKLKGYLFTSIKNSALKQLEKRDPLRHPHVLEDMTFEMFDPDDLTEEMILLLQAEIEKLPPRTREVLRAVYVDGLKYKEVARKFQITIATVKTILMRAIKRLREVLASWKKKY